MSSNNQARVSENSLTRLKGLREQLQPGEEPLFNIPAIWDGGQSNHSTPCDVIVTNQRIIGFYHRSFPRERLFLDAIPLNAIKAVSFRHKTNEPLFRELLINTGERQIFIRAPRRKLEELYTILRAAIEAYAPQTHTTLNDAEAANEQVANQPASPTFGRQEIRTPLERSSLAITILFVGGIGLEILGFVLTSMTGSLQIGIPLFIAGLVSVAMSIILRRQRG